MNIFYCGFCAVENVRKLGTLEENEDGIDNEYKALFKTF